MSAATLQMGGGIRGDLCGSVCARFGTLGSSRLRKWKIRSACVQVVVEVCLRELLHALDRRARIPERLLSHAVVDIHMKPATTVRLSLAPHEFVDSIFGCKVGVVLVEPGNKSTQAVLLIEDLYVAPLIRDRHPLHLAARLLGRRLLLRR